MLFFPSLKMQFLFTIITNIRMFSSIPNISLKYSNELLLFFSYVKKFLFYEI